MKTWLTSIALFLGAACADAASVSSVGQTFLSAGSGDLPVARTNTGLESPGNRQAKKPALRAAGGTLSTNDVAAPDFPTNRPTVLVAVGAVGTTEFGSNFLQQAAQWERACQQAGCRYLALGLEAAGATNDHDRLRQILENEPKKGSGELWLVLIGHGTFDGQEARFNLRGPDVAATELGLWLRPFERPTVVIDTTSCSAPFLNKLSATNRIVITATRSGHEQSFSRFGQFLAEAITDAQADLDQDGEVSLLEAFLAAARQVSEFYKTAGRLATEHALLDDNGDGLGTPADWFRGVRAIKKPGNNAQVDGLRAHQCHLAPGQAERELAPEQRARRDALEGAVVRHREKKGQLAEDEYYAELEKLLLELARCYQFGTGPR
jgi:hypothetical protein